MRCSIPTLWTIGHSTRSLAELVALLEANGIEAVADVRRFPGSRRQPQFQAGELETGLEKKGIAYCWLPALGGRRRPDPASPNTGWRHAAFRGYADHLSSEEFAEGLFELVMLASGARTAMLCAEALWWRCHRRLIADVVVSLGGEVLHIDGRGAAIPHRLAPPARLAHGALTYSQEAR